MNEALPALFVATMREVAPIKGRFRSVQRLHRSQPDLRLGIYEGKPLLLVITGAGAQAASQATQWVLERYTLSMAYILGVSGGLSDEFVRGDSLLVSWVEAVFLDDSTRQTPRYDVDSALLKQSRTILDLPTSGLVSADRLVCQACEKRRLFECRGGSAVDLETFYIVEQLVKKNVPWLAIRSISDAVDDEMPTILQKLFDPDISSLRRCEIIAKLAVEVGFSELALLRKRVQISATKLEANLRRLHKSFSLDKGGCAL